MSLVFSLYGHVRRPDCNYSVSPKEKPYPALRITFAQHNAHRLPSFPTPQTIATADEFMARLPEFDEHFAKLNADAAARKEVLRYVGIVDPSGKCAAQLRRSVSLSFSIIIAYLVCKVYARRIHGESDQMISRPIPKIKHLFLCMHVLCPGLGMPCCRGDVRLSLLPVCKTPSPGWTSKHSQPNPRNYFPQLPLHAPVCVAQGLGQHHCLHHQEVPEPAHCARSRRRCPGDRRRHL